MLVQSRKKEGKKKWIVFHIAFSSNFLCKILAMSDIEEQSDEAQVLMSIYDQDFAWVQEPDEYTIRLAPTIEGEGAQVHVSVVLHVKYPSNYPSASIPSFQLELHQGLSKRQLEEMRELAEETSTASLGGPSVFGVCEALKEWLSDNNIPGQDDSMYAQMIRREQQKGLVATKKEKIAKVAKEADAEDKQSIDPAELERIRKRQAGEQVTPESFLRWKTAFELEMRNKAIAELDAGAEFDNMQLRLLGIADSTRLSGKEIWLSKLQKGESFDEAVETTVDEAGNIVQAMGSDDIVMDADAEARMYERFQLEQSARKQVAAAGGLDADDWSDGSSSEYSEGDECSYDEEEDENIDYDEEDGDEEFVGDDFGEVSHLEKNAGAAPVTRAAAKKKA